MEEGMLRPHAAMTAHCTAQHARQRRRRGAPGYPGERAGATTVVAWRLLYPESMHRRRHLPTRLTGSLECMAAGSRDVDTGVAWVVWSCRTLRVATKAAVMPTERQWRRLDKTAGVDRGRSE